MSNWHIIHMPAHFGWQVWVHVAKLNMERKAGSWTACQQCSFKTAFKQGQLWLELISSKHNSLTSPERLFEECRGELAGWVGECHEVISLPSANRRWFHRVCTKPPEVCWCPGTGPGSPRSLPPSHGIPLSLRLCPVISLPIYWWKCRVKGMSSSAFPGTWIYLSVLSIPLSLLLSKTVPYFWALGLVYSCFPRALFS